MTTSQEFSLVEDPYERFLKDEAKSANLISNNRSSKLSRKFHNFKETAKHKRDYFVAGGLQGFMIGCLAGFGIGIVSAIQSRRLILIPISMAGFAVFFSGVMAVGSIIRTDDRSLPFWESESSLMGKEPLPAYIIQMNEQLKGMQSKQL